MLSRFVEEGSKVELRALEHGLGESGAENTTKVYQSRTADPIGGYTGDFHANGTDQTDPSAGGKRI